MLTAKLSNGEVISLVENQNKNHLQELRNNEIFYCRSCSEKVILKLGTKRIYHFAHEKGTTCTEDYDRESEYHMNGKMKLYAWLKNQGLSPELECYYPAIKQRADIAFTYNEKTYCLEYQCSTISAELFRKRTEGYQKRSFIPIWILGGKNIHRLGPHKASLSSFHYLFLRETAEYQGYLPSYCPQADHFITLESLIPVSTRNTHCHFSLKPLNKFTIQELIEPKGPFKFYWKEWRRDMNRFKSSLLAHTMVNLDPFLLELYSRSLNPYFLPSFVGLPLRSNYAIETPPFIWQAYIFLDHFYGQNIGKEIHFQEVYLQVLKRVRTQEIRLRSFPCLKRNLLPFAIDEYLGLLSDSGLLRKCEQNKYLIVKSINIAKNMEEWEKEEEIFYKHFLQ